MIRLEDKNAIVTGANRGLGKAFVEGLAQAGCNVWGVMRTESEEFLAFAKKLEKENNVFVEPIYADLTQERSIKTAYELINKEKKTIDILINNAGIAHMGLFQMTKMEFVHQVYQVNVFAPMIWSRSVLRNMIRQKKGRIINVASTAAEEVYEGNSVYGASKAALEAFTKSFGAEVYKYGVTVNAIAPGLINTDMSVVFEGKDPKEPIRHTALGRKIEPKEIVDVVLNMLSDDMSIVNGTVVTINGGHK